MTGSAQPLPRPLGDPGHPFDAQDVTIAIAVAILAQLLFVLVFSLPSPKLVEADISNENAQPIAVAITPVLKLGSKNPTKMPSQWQRKRPVAAKQPPQAALPSTQAEKTPEAIPTSRVPDASVAPAVVDASKVEQPNPTAPEEAGAVTTAASAEGSEQGAANGTETDPLKARAADMYRDQLQRWFASHFHIRGKIPFDTLKTLHASVTVTVTEDRKVGSFTIVKPSGDATFDAEVQATLSGIQSGGAELPAPPPLYPDMLGKTLPVRFGCSERKQCE
ncbi:MAG TPA: TonB C-terminal domain-containing protein [Polyangiaceae bacterium]|nr:TonB C-terminal domain-containing protein [Polyangiaceae bacterium]